MARTPAPLPWIVSLCVAGAMALAAAPAAAQQAKVLNDGKVEFEANCAACHGKSAMGDGKMAELLTARPPDLTRLAQRNGGVFPFWQVYDTIGGDTPARAHALTPMPLWGKRFRAEEEQFYYAPAHVRILLITHYLESIQEK